MQMLLFPDPRPLVERLGADFFRRLPRCPGIYLMRDGADQVLYVGKAKNLRKRLASYRVANPDRMPRRHLRLLRAVERIEWRECADEAAALASESELLRSLRPRFNRAGVWPGTPRFLVWRATGEGLDLGVQPAPPDGWLAHGPLGAGVFGLRAALARLLWCALHTGKGFPQMPQGWFRGHHGEVAVISRHDVDLEKIKDAESRVRDLFAGDSEGFAAWIRQRLALRQPHPFESAVIEADLERLVPDGVVAIQNRDPGLGAC
jgi:predicted GIY-YIG superfamily endonuclease